jgi:ketosteroid isomerase-like protein
VRRFVVAVAVSMLTGVAAVPASARPQPSTPQAAPAGATRAADQVAAAAVERLERELVAAIAAGDLGTYDRIVADDYVAYTTSGDLQTKPQIMASYRTGTRKYFGLAITDVTVRVFGDTAILVARTAGTRIEDGGARVPNLVRYFRVFTKRNGQWRAVMQMVTPLSAAENSRRP